MSEQIMVQIRFSEDTEVGTFTDALYLTMYEYVGKPQSEIDTLKQARVTTFVNSVKNAVPAPEPTKAELQADVANLQKQIDSLNIKIGSK